MGDTPMPPVIAVDPPQPLRGVRAIRFRASSFIEDSDTLLATAVGQALAWIAENRDHVAPLRIDFEHTDTASRVGRQRGMLAAIYEASWSVAAVLYYDEGNFDD